MHDVSVTESAGSVSTVSTVTFDPDRQSVLVFHKQRELGIVIDAEYEAGVIWAKSAQETYQAMAFHVANLRAYYGDHNDWVTKAAESFAHTSASIVGWGNVTVTKDGPLSLFCQVRGGSFVFGIIFHAVHRSCTVEGCPMYANDNGAVWSYRPHDEIKVQLHKHRWLYPIGAPAPGTWSFHS